MEGAMWWIVGSRYAKEWEEERGATTASTHAKLLSADNIPAPLQFLISANVIALLDHQSGAAV